MSIFAMIYCKRNALPKYLLNYRRKIENPTSLVTGTTKRDGTYSTLTCTANWQKKLRVLYIGLEDVSVLLFKDKHMFFCFLVLTYDYVIVTKKKFSKTKETKRRNKWVRKALMLIYKIIRIKKVLYSIKFFCFHTQKHSI